MIDHRGLCQSKQMPAGTPKKKKKKDSIGSGTTPYINKGKGDTLAREREELVRIWRMTSQELLDFSRVCLLIVSLYYIVCIEHRMSM